MELHEKEVEELEQIAENLEQELRKELTPA